MQIATAFLLGVAVGIAICRKRRRRPHFRILSPPCSQPSPLKLHDPDSEFPYWSEAGIVYSDIPEHIQQAISTALRKRRQS